MTCRPLRSARLPFALIAAGIAIASAAHAAKPFLPEIRTSAEIACRAA